MFDDLAAGQRPQTEFHINGTKYSMGYYLADGIYPDWATLVKTYSEPVSEKEKKNMLRHRSQQGRMWNELLGCFGPNSG